MLFKQCDLAWEEGVLIFVIRVLLAAFFSGQKWHCKLVRDVLSIQHNPPLLTHVPTRTHNFPHLLYCLKHTLCPQKAEALQARQWERKEGVLQAVLLHLNEEKAWGDGLLVTGSREKTQNCNNER